MIVNGTRGVQWRPLIIQWWRWSQHFIVIYLIIYSTKHFHWLTLGEALILLMLLMMMINDTTTTTTCHWAPLLCLYIRRLSNWCKFFVQHISTKCSLNDLKNARKKIHFNFIIDCLVTMHYFFCKIFVCLYAVHDEKVHTALTPPCRIVMQFLEQHRIHKK